MSKEFVENLITELTPKTIKENFGCSRQQISNWKGNEKVPLKWILAFKKAYPNLQVWKKHEKELKSLNIL